MVIRRSGRGGNVMKCGDSSDSEEEESHYHVEERKLSIGSIITMPKQQFIIKVAIIFTFCTPILINNLSTKPLYFPPSLASLPLLIVYFGVANRVR